MNAISSRLRLARGKVSAKNFARLLGCNSQTVYRYEWGQRTPDEEYLQKVSKISGRSLEWLKGFEAPYDEQRSRPTFYAKIDRNCSSCERYREQLEKLEKKLEITEEERRELSAEVRQLYRDKENLLMENAELKERLGKLEGSLMSPHREKDRGGTVGASASA